MPVSLFAPPYYFFIKMVEYTESRSQDLAIATRIKIF